MRRPARFARGGELLLQPRRDRLLDDPQPVWNTGLFIITSRDNRVSR